MRGTSSSGAAPRADIPRYFVLQFGDDNPSAAGTRVT